MIKEIEQLANDLAGRTTGRVSTLNDKFNFRFMNNKFTLIFYKLSDRRRHHSGHWMTYSKSNYGNDYQKML
jgi:hypothetical protein